MVKLTDKLMEILDLRKGDFSGKDIKLVVESIAISEGIGAETKSKEQSEHDKKVMQEWMLGGSE